VKLSQFPFVRLKVRCRPCDRLGCYRLARLAARFGPEADLYEVVIPELALDCPYISRKPKWFRWRTCQIEIDGLDQPFVPDMPAEPLKVIEGGKK
jgi:hypothetical protein